MRVSMNEDRSYDFRGICVICEASCSGALSFNIIPRDAYPAFVSKYGFRR